MDQDMDDSSSIVSGLTNLYLDKTDGIKPDECRFSRIDSEYMYMAPPSTTSFYTLKANNANNKSTFSTNYQIRSRSNKMELRI